MNRQLKWLGVLVMSVVLMSCNITTNNTSNVTRIDYMRIAGDLNFWNTRAKSPFVSLSEFFVNVKTGQSTSIFLLNEKGEKRMIASAEDGKFGAITLPVMTLEEANNWVLIVDKPEWQVRITPAIDIALPSKKVRYQDLFVVLNDYNTRRDEVDTMPSWLRQDHYRLLVTFPIPSDVFYMPSNDEKQRYGPAKEKTLILELNEEYFRENGWLIFSHMPSSIMAIN